MFPAGGTLYKFPMKTEKTVNRYFEEDPVFVMQIRVKVVGRFKRNLRQYLFGTVVARFLERLETSEGLKITLERIPANFYSTGRPSDPLDVVDIEILPPVKQDQILDLFR